MAGLRGLARKRHFEKHIGIVGEILWQATYVQLRLGSRGMRVYAQWQVIREPMVVAAVPALGPRERTPGNPARGYSASTKWGITQRMNDDKAHAPCGFGQPKVAELRGRTCSSLSFYRLRLAR